ncbi:4-alpha-glucanotransferase [Tessaracoccus sp. OS52]|uniref:4-alpha-glucanotransferase n=1 Tax=Tessaracoccus sp. OS52 TaxID=2886691 RepID=UPI001D11E450|nr:4-alpha-glucanotransferase [Tessaracoccus sp. OS52]
MSQLPDGLAELADHYGIAREFWDWKGRHTLIPAETIIHVLGALGVTAETQEDRDAARARLHEVYWRRVLPPCTVVVEGDVTRIPVHVPAGTSVGVQVLLESGERRSLGQVDNDLPDVETSTGIRGEATFVVPEDLPLGYHTLIASGEEGVSQASLIVTPRFVGFPLAMRDERIWGYATQLYSVRSRKSWGLGDLTDLADLITWSGTRQFAGYVLVNPLHAAEPTAPMEPSPYLPASRRFMNPIYIRPESIPEFADLDPVARTRIRRMRTQLEKDSNPAVIDRNSAWLAKREALELVHAVGRRAARDIAFDDFRYREGSALRNFAVWSVLSEEFGTNWMEWPQAYRSPGTPEVLDYAAAHAGRIEFYEWLQWIAHTQVSAAQTVAREVGMRVGVVTDLAVGVSASGAETWMMRDLFADGIHVGAPPDQYNQAGQDWGQPPWRPDRLEEVAYAPFRAMVAATLRRVGGVRIDHIIGLFRLWWVPQGLGPKFGTYVRNNHEALVGILALEAHRAQALVVGEDLGTVEPWVRDYLARRGILGTSVLWFEADEHGRPLAADRWREYCMASVTTHDLPPTLGYLAGDHVRLRDDLGLLTEPLEEELTAARGEQAGWLEQLLDRGLLTHEHREDPEQVMLALHRYLRLTPSKVLQAALVDAVGERRAQNQPGTHNEYPNWRIPLADSSGEPIWLEDIFSAELPRRLAAVMNGLERQPHSRWDPDADA